MYVVLCTKDSSLRSTCRATLSIAGTTAWKQCHYFWCLKWNIAMSLNSFVNHLLAPSSRYSDRVTHLRGDHESRQDCPLSLNAKFFINLSKWSLAHLRRNQWKFRHEDPGPPSLRRTLSILAQGREFPRWNTVCSQPQPFIQDVVEALEWLRTWIILKPPWTTQVISWLSKLVCFTSSSVHDALGCLTLPYQNCELPPMLRP